MRSFHPSGVVGAIVIHAHRGDGWRRMAERNCVYNAMVKYVRQASGVWAEGDAVI